MGLHALRCDRVAGFTPEPCNLLKRPGMVGQMWGELPGTHAAAALWVEKKVERFWIYETSPTRLMTIKIGRKVSICIVIKGIGGLYTSSAAIQNR